MLKKRITSIKKLLIDTAKSHMSITVTDTESHNGFISFGGLRIANRYKNLYIGKTNQVKSKRRIYPYSPETVQRLAQTEGLIVIQHEKLIKGMESEVLMNPNFFDLVLRLPPTFDEYYKLLSERARSDVRKIQKMGYTCALSTDASWVGTFSKNYYVPSMLNRHAEEAYLISVPEILEIAERPGAEFIQIYEGEVCVAATLCIKEDQKYSYLRVGWLNGDTKFMNAGATAAIYYFIIKRAYELGCDKISLGGTPSYVENGLLKYKAKWLASFQKDVYYGINYLMINPKDENCHNFLKQVSPIVLNHKKQLLVLSSKKPKEVSMPGVILADIEGWFILQDNRAEQPFEATEELPKELRHWYTRFNEL